MRPILSTNQFKNCCLVLSLLASSSSVFAQTDAEIAAASKYIGRPQSKSSTLAFFAGFYEQRKQYSKAIDYNEKMLALFEKDLGKDSPKVAWALSKIAYCYSLDGKEKLAEPYYKHCWEMLQQTALGDPKFVPFEIESLSTCASHFRSTNQNKEAEAVDKRLKLLRDTALTQPHQK